ncbi:hypothetical protein PHSC3_001457 [Chlamydiales bacterium STE3]|nr:hypothetical protein PHSC3_001457 [Chlamydiales bacterium STE3]
MDLTAKSKYRIRNWSDYNKVLIQLGSITLWFSEETARKWHEIDRTGKRGRPKDLLRLFRREAPLFLLTGFTKGDSYIGYK